MVHRPACVLAFTLAAFAASAHPALAQQTLNFSLGYFKANERGRVETDILLIEHADLAFEIGDFSTAAVGGEWLVPIGNLFEAGAGVSFSRQTVSAVYVRVPNSDGNGITRELGLRQLPVAFTARILPLGQSYRVQPYAGGGVVLVKWRFSESGDFVAANRDISRGEQYVATGNAMGPIILFGLRVAGDTIAYGFEARHQDARGSLGPLFAKVVDPDIDLDGWTLQFTAGMRFGE